MRPPPFAGSPAVILRILGAAVLLALLGAAPAYADETRNADATLVWDITRQCFRPRSQPEAECGVRWNADTRRFAAPHQTATPAPATELDKVLAEEMSNVRALRRNAGVEQMRGAAAALESMIDTRPQPAAPLQ